MYPAPSLKEAFPNSKPPVERIPYDPCRGDQQPATSPTKRSASQSPPRRPSDPLSIAGITELTDEDVVVGEEVAVNSFGAEASQSIFSVKDGAEILQNRRASRRRTGPLSAQQREKAALIRKLGACTDCRRRRVACSPHHHDMTWEDAIRKYRSSSPHQDLASPPHNRSGSIHRRKSSGESQRNDFDSASTLAKVVAAPASRLSSNDARIRTPLPSAPRLEKTMSMPSVVSAPSNLPPISNFSSFRTNLEKSVSSILVPGRSRRYVAGHVLLVLWEDDDDAIVASSVSELCSVLEEQYSYNCEVARIPSSKSDACKNPSRWLSRHIDDFMERHDSWDCLKIVYYIGFSFLDHARDMVLSSSLSQPSAPTIRWSGIQHKLEEACSDTLVIMDAAYFPSSRIARQKGVLEILAASTTEEYFRLGPRAGFTRLVLDRLRGGAHHQVPPTVGEDRLSTAELYSRILFSYSELNATRNSLGGGSNRSDERNDRPYSAHGVFPLMPLHIQISSNPSLPPITLTRMDSLQLPPLSAPSYSLSSSRANGFDESGGGGGGGGNGSSGRHLSLTFRLADDISGREGHDVERWRQWLMMMPEGVRSVKVDDYPQLRT